MRSIQRAADAILLTAAGGSLLFFFFNVTRHGWAGHYLIFLSLALLLCAALRLPVSKRGSLVLVLLSTGIGLYGLEVLVGQILLSPARFSMNDWLNFPQDVNSSVAVNRIKEAKATNASFDTRTRLEVVSDLRQQGIMAFPTVFPTVLFQSTGKGIIQSRFTSGDDEFLPLTGISNVTTVFCNEGGEYIVYDSDEHGFHNPSGLWQPGQADIVAIGDSYTHGACVHSDKGFVSVIRSRYPATVNLGVGGDGPLAMLATLKEYATVLSPKVLLWCYYEGNDLRDLDGREKFSRLLRTYLTSSFSQNLISRQREVDEALKEYLEETMASQGASFNIEEFLKLQRLRASLRAAANRRTGREGLQVELVDHLERDGAPSTQDDLELFRDILKEASRVVSSWGGRMIFVYLPAWTRYRLPDLASTNRDTVLRIVNELSLPMVDVHGAFARHPDPLSFFPSRRYAHYNAAGHRLVAEQVLAYLETDALLK